MIKRDPYLLSGGRRRNRSGLLVGSSLSSGSNVAPGGPPVYVPFTFPGSDAISVNENTLVIGTYTATGGSEPTKNYSISASAGPENADSALFVYGPASGVLSFVSGRDFETPADAGADNVYNVQLVCDDGTTTLTQDLAVTVLDVVEGAHTWTNTLFNLATDRPAITVAPIIVDTQAKLDVYDTTYSELPPGAGSPIYPFGPCYYISAGGSDVVIDSRSFGPVDKTLFVTEARNVILTGSFVPALVPAGAPGLCSTQDEVGGLLTNRNVEYRPVGGCGVSVSCTHVVHLEGAMVDLQGQGCDGVVVNGVFVSTPASTQADLEIQCVNSWIGGYVGSPADYVGGGPGGVIRGDAPHADSIHFQGEPLSYKRFRCENFTMMSGQEGVVANPFGAWAQEFHAKNMTAFIDERYVSADQTRHGWVAPIGINAKIISVENCVCYMSEVWNTTFNTLGLSENHWLWWSNNAVPSKIMYFTADSDWGNTGDGDLTTPVAPGAVLDMETWEPFGYVAGGNTSVVRNAGLITVPGTIDGGDLAWFPAYDVAPLNHVGNNYVNGTLY